MLDPQPTLRRYQGEYTAHEHGYAQVLVGLQGSLELEIGGHGAFVDASCGLIVPAGVGHGYLARHPASVMVIDTPMRKGLDRVRRFQPSGTWRRLAYPVEAMLDELSGSPTLLPRRRLDIAALEAKVDAQLHRSWTTAQLAALCHMSPQRFHARFAELVGAAPMAWLRGRRLDAAQRLLRGGMTLEAAAAQVGYATASALAFALKRERGVGARALR
ncbi:MAG: AraC family transcriptional regulator [Burkholderiales bacterium]|nr:AraC family transcriptional regulator [Burkholderiales bacterium]